MQKEKRSFSHQELIFFNFKSCAFALFFSCYATNNVKYEINTIVKWYELWKNKRIITFEIKNAEMKKCNFSISDAPVWFFLSYKCTVCQNPNVSIFHDLVLSDRPLHLHTWQGLSRLWVCDGARVSCSSSARCSSYPVLSNLQGKNHSLILRAQCSCYNLLRFEMLASFVYCTPACCFITEWRFVA